VGASQGWPTLTRTPSGLFDLAEGLAGWARAGCRVQVWMGAHVFHTRGYAPCMLQHRRQASAPPCAGCE